MYVSRISNTVPGKNKKIFEEVTHPLINMVNMHDSYENVMTIEDLNISTNYLNTFTILMSYVTSLIYKPYLYKYLF